MPRLRRVDPGESGLTRRRRGRGFELVGAAGERVENGSVLERVNALAIPPAWKDVWISEDLLGHIQATGVDQAGRRQYIYHPQWHAQRARRKFADMEQFATALPALRARVAGDLDAGGLGRDRVLACVVRLLDRGFFRIGCDDYAESNGSYGLATMRKEHVSLPGDDVLLFDFPAKSGQRRVQHVVDPASTDVVRALKRRRGGGEELFAFQEAPRRPWRDVKADHVNDYLKAVTGLAVSAKDFRTWNATVLAAMAIAVADPKAQTTARRRAPSTTARKRAIGRAIREVARYLGNTPTVARNSYIDPRVFDRFLAGSTIGPALAVLEDIDPGSVATQGPIEEAVLELLGSGRVMSGKR